MAEIGRDINKAKELLLAGELVAIPTETVYGLAANALDINAVEKIFTTKNRPKLNPLILHLPNIQRIDKYVSYIPEKAKLLIENFMPGAITLVLPKTDIVPDIISAGLSTVAIRIPEHYLTLELLATLDFPLAAPSANPFGAISPTHPAHVQEQIGDKIHYILNGGQCFRGLESTIIGFENDEPVLYRYGAISVEEIEAIVGKIEIKNQDMAKPIAPGMLPHHYAPKTPLYLADDALQMITQLEAKKIGLISYGDITVNTEKKIVHIELSANADLEEAARNLYSALHDLDSLLLDAIVVQKFAEDGLGITLNDRLTKASNKKYISK